MLKDTRFLVNPTGRFEIGGPHGDAGLTGRKIIVDTYGGAAPHGGGAFSGKDPSKVDRSAAYAARYVAKNIVAAGIARQCQVQVAYAIGVAQPMNVTVYTEGTGKIPDEQIAELVQRALRPAAEGHRRACSTCCARSTARPPRTATSAATSPSSRGSARTRRGAARGRRHQVMRVSFSLRRFLLRHALPRAAASACAGSASHRHAPCSAAARRSSKSVDLDNAPDGTKVTLARGNELKVMLDAQALAGFQWRGPKELAPMLSPIGERIFLSKGLDPRYLGGGGWNVFRYRAERSGKVVLTFEYGPFDLTTPATKSVRYEITVE